MNFFITVNNREIEAMKGETILQALRRAGISIPTLCNMEGFTPSGACRLCVVEVSGKKDLVTACSYPVEEWMEIQTHSPRVIKARRIIVELLLAGHPDDCLYCERNVHCELQNLAYELNIRERKSSGKKINKIKDLSSPAIVRDPAKCILCGRCVRICEEVMACSTFEFLGKGNMSGITTTYNQGINLSSCITCGQCIMACPTSALYERTNMPDLQLALSSSKHHPVALVDPVVSITLAEIHGNRNARLAAKQLNALLKKCGFKEVYDFAAAHDLYIRKTAEEIMERKGETLLSSNCPAWIKYAEQFMQESLPSLSKIKSPSQLGGSVIKYLHASDNKKQGTPTPFVVSITPCTARKFEAKRKEFSGLPTPEVDLAITIRTLGQLIRLNGLDMNQTETEDFNKPFHISSMHGELGGLAGGTMEAVAATLYHILSGGKELTDARVKKNRVWKDLKEIEFTIQKKHYRFAAISGMAEASRFIREAMNKPGYYQYIEVMACPGGCINGGGQPINGDLQRYRSRHKPLSEMAGKNALTSCMRNRNVDELAALLTSAPATPNSLFATDYYPRKIQ